MLKSWATFSLIWQVLIVNAVYVKRDTLTDIGDVLKDAGDSIKEVVGLKNEKKVMADIEYDDRKFCVSDSNCVEQIQYCNKSTYKVYGTCDFVVWFWLAVAGASTFIFCCCCSILCCCCCRKSS